MIPRECKRLAEVDFPIAEVSKHAAREKSIRHGHPSTLHLWWARRPLASSRAVLMALLLPDPCDKHCPETFKKKARRLLSQVANCDPGTTDETLRKALLRFIGDFANWDLAANRTYLDVSRAMVKAAHGEEPPLVVDPFAGGGSIPLEALRLGCEAFASDLNPVARLILQVMLEDIPRHGPGLADELRKVGGEIKRQAERELADLYPTDPDGARPIAYLWARTVRCEAPNCGAEIPLMRSFWLCKKAKRKHALRHRVARPEGEPPHVEFEVFEPKADEEVHGGTVTRAKATCVCCGAVLPPERVRAQLAAQKGGADAIFDEKGGRTGGARMTAVVTLQPGQAGRHYRLPTDVDYAAVRKAQERVAGIFNAWEREGKQGLCPVPDEPLPPIGTLGFRVQRYGMLQWGDLFTARQKVALVELAGLIRETEQTDSRESSALALSKLSELACSICAWEPIAECTRHVFGRQAVPITWDFGEGVLTSSSSGSFQVSLGNTASGLDAVGSLAAAASPQIADATNHPLPDQTAGIWFTDPPYYDAVPYADLSDFFLVWIERALPDHPLMRDPFDPDNPLSPKTAEAVQDETKQTDGQPKDREWFEETMAKAFAEGRRVLQEDGVGSVVFAHKTTEGWEALLSGMIRGGWKFVEQLCSADGATDALIREIERVIFTAHSQEDRMGAESFRGLLDIRASRGRQRRAGHERAIAETGGKIGSERDKQDAVPEAQKQRARLKIQIDQDKTERAKLVTEDAKAHAQALEKVSAAADTLRGRIEQARRRLEALHVLGDDVKAFREWRAENEFEDFKERHTATDLKDGEWAAFRTDYVGDVDGVINSVRATTTDQIKRLSGPGTDRLKDHPGKTQVTDSGDPSSSTNSLIPANTNLTDLPLSVLEQEEARLRRLIGADEEKRTAYRRLSDRITASQTQIGNLDKAIAAGDVAEEKISALLAARNRSYQGVFEGLEAEGKALTELYSPLNERLSQARGALGKLTCSIRRNIDLAAWAKKGEALLDLRKAGDFRGRGALPAAAEALLLEAWRTGSAEAVVEAMATFRRQHDENLHNGAPVEKTDKARYRAWAGEVSSWLYSTDHIRVSYGMQHEGVDIETLSPGTRGIVLLLLYLAIDTEDDRPLIIDQPEENLDPKSIFDELVELFRQAKQRRQIIITHNANLVVNTDADQVIVSECGQLHPGKLPEIGYTCGSLENADIRAHVCSILEGGEEAFRERAKRLRVDVTTA